MKVSVIVPCYNLGKYLEEAIDSILNQTFQDYEIIVINDGSTDDYTNTLLKNYSRPKTTILHTSNQGLPATRNFGIERATGDYICCLDADDKYHPEFLEKTVSFFEKDIKNEFGIVSSYYETFENSSKLFKVIDCNPSALAVENQLHVASLFRKECWSIVGGYDTGLTGYHDWNFWLSIISKNYKWFTIKESLFYYRDRTGSMLKDSNTKRIELIKRIISNNSTFFMENYQSILEEFVVSSTKQLIYAKALSDENEYYKKQNEYYKKQNELYEKEIETLKRRIAPIEGFLNQFLPKCGFFRKLLRRIYTNDK